MEINYSSKKNYIGIKLKVFSRFLWFELKNTKCDPIMFSGTDGWCGNGTIDTKFELNDIVGIIYSDVLLNS